MDCLFTLPHWPKVVDVLNPNGRSIGMANDTIPWYNKNNRRAVHNLTGSLFDDPVQISEKQG